MPAKVLTSVRRILRLDPEVRLPSVQARDGFRFFATLDRFQQDAYRSLRLRYPGPREDCFCKVVALKAANAFAADYHFRNRHSVLVSRPLQLQVDPTNVCRLQCPSCLHTANTAWASRFDWPSATLGIGQFDEFCNEFGPFATGIALFRDGEPLLHRGFPEFVTRAKSHLLYTLTSTSLSVRIDAEALVASGLDRLVAAIDGATAATYSRYRRGGDFDLVMENLRALVRARKAQSSVKPWIVWQFLAFEHNAHEIELAARLSREIGLDQLVVARPHSVEHDDPSIKVADTAPFGTTLFAETPDWCTSTERAAVMRHAERIDSLFGESWVHRYATVAGEERTPPAAQSTCDWLYYSVTMDAARRVTPCCLPPMGPPEPRHLVYAKFNGRNTGEVVNSPDAMLARHQCRSGRPAEGELDRPAPYCLSCKANPVPPMSPDASRYLVSVDERQALPAAVRDALAACPLFAAARSRD